LQTNITWVSDNHVPPHASERTGFRLWVHKLPNICLAV
jgi:hypothetical protein